MQSIPKELINLANLYCSKCEKVQSIPKELTKLTILYCGCTALQSIPKELTKLTHLDCSGCTALQSIPKELTKLAYLDCSECTALQSIPKELANLAVLYCNGCIMVYIPSTIAKKFNKKSRGANIRNWICRAQYRAARNAEKRVALSTLQNLVSGNSQVFDKNVTAVFNRVRV
jgi:Leucine-rich repeat (LRR) protein